MDLFVNRSPFIIYTADDFCLDRPAVARRLFGFSVLGSTFWEECKINSRCPIGFQLSPARYRICEGYYLLRRKDGLVFAGGRGEIFMSCTFRLGLQLMLIASQMPSTKRIELFLSFNRMKRIDFLDFCLAPVHFNLISPRMNGTSLSPDVLPTKK